MTVDQTFMDWTSPNHHRVAAIAFASLVGLSTGGCVALGVPSERYHDPHDHGGLLGDWRGGVTTPDAHAAGLMEDGAVLVPPRPGLAELCRDDHCVDTSGIYPMDIDPVTGLPYDKTPKPPEVPWPRYHPVPTRPVFGGYR